MGVAYKRDIDDVRKSPALDIIHLLQRRGAEVTFRDPYVPFLHLDDKGLFSKDLNETVEAADCVAILTDYTAVNYPKNASAVSEANRCGFLRRKLAIPI